MTDDFNLVVNRIMQAQSEALSKAVQELSTLSSGSGIPSIPAKVLIWVLDSTASSVMRELEKKIKLLNRKGPTTIKIHHRKTHKQYQIAVSQI